MICERARPLHPVCFPDAFIVIILITIVSLDSYLTRAALLVLQEVAYVSLRLGSQRAVRVELSILESSLVVKEDLSLQLFNFFLILFTRCVFLISNDVYKQLTWAISHAILLPRTFILVEYLVCAFLVT